MKKLYCYISLLIIGMAQAPTYAGPTSHFFKAAASAATFRHTIPKIFNFNAIASNARSGKPVNGIWVKRDKQGNIIALNDGKKTPLILGSIPTSERDLGKVAAQFKVPKTAGIDVLSMNRWFEINWSGLSKAFHKKNKHKLFRYPTTDLTAPSLANLIRVTRDIKHRDQRHQALTYVHCRAGKGRSATAIAAYLFCTLHEAGFKVTMKQVEDYIKRCRPQIHINHEQKKILESFAHELKKAGSLAALCNKHRGAIAVLDHKY